MSSDSFDEGSRQRQDFVNLSMKDRLKEFSDNVDSTIFCGTWNVCNKSIPPSQSASLRQWLFPGIKPIYADIYAIGFQEIVDLNARNVVIDNTKSHERAMYWNEQLSKILQSTNVPYVYLIEKHLVGLLLVIYVKEALLPQISDIRTTSVANGIMGVMANKGGVIIRFKLYDSSLCFICSHLRARQNEVAGRNMDYKIINEKTKLYPTLYDDDNTYNNTYNNTMISSLSLQTASSPLLKSSNQWRLEELSQELSIENHDFIFWFGDLNYRIAMNLDRTITCIQDIFTHIDNQVWYILHDYDQLNYERKRGTVFHGYHEGELQFLPTYKYQVGTIIYEKRPEKKLRGPAWCDRILYKSKYPVQIIQYNSVMIPISDHMPIYGLFNITGKVINTHLETETYKSILNMYDTLQNEIAPKVDIKNRIIDLQGIKREDLPIRHYMKIVNIGRVPVKWKFNYEVETTPTTKKPYSQKNTRHHQQQQQQQNNNRYSHEQESLEHIHNITIPPQTLPTWLSFNPISGTLYVGESIDVEVMLDINILTGNDIMRQINKAFDHIAVIEIKNGSHFFCTISGSLAFDHFDDNDDDTEKDDDDRSQT